MDFISRHYVNRNHLSWTCFETKWFEWLGRRPSWNFVFMWSWFTLFLTIAFCISERNRRLWCFYLILFLVTDLLTYINRFVQYCYKVTLQAFVQILSHLVRLVLHINVTHSVLSGEPWILFVSTLKSFWAPAETSQGVHSKFGSLIFSFTPCVGGGDAGWMAISTPLSQPLSWWESLYLELELVIAKNKWYSLCVIEDPLRFYI
jgi:hypothetical protein